MWKRFKAWLSEYLAEPNPYLIGSASCFDFGGALGTTLEDVQNMPSDYDAIASDWRSVGFDMWRAIDEYEQE